MKMGRRGRLGVAGIVATVIMFAILFTVGTSYFIFVNAQNAQYADNLQAATNKLQGSLDESLTITTLLETDGDIGFYANDTGGQSVNMTVIYVLSSSSTLLYCDGIGSTTITGVPAAASCHASTPNLWIVVNSGKGSSTIDTGYVYVSGTDIVRVLTARGNAFSATYPATAANNAVNAETSDSLLVNLNLFRWHALTPEATSMATPVYSAATGSSSNECNTSSTTCSLTYSTNPTVADTLVYGIGWYGQSTAPTVSDSQNSQWVNTVSGQNGASSIPIVETSNTYTNTPSVYQHTSTTCTSASSCGTSFGSATNAGDTLVASLGWLGSQTATGISDPRGSTWHQEADEQTTVTPPNPSVYQHVYATCTSTTSCGGTMSSAVTTGDVLAYGLGWSAAAPYVPVTVSNCATFEGALALDGDNHNSGTGSSLSATLTTADSNDVIIAIVYGQNSQTGTYRTATMSDSAGLTWTERGNYQEQSNAGGNSMFTGIYYAIASSPLSSDSIKVTWSSAPSLYGWIQVFGVAGANTGSPFDGASPSYTVAGSYASETTANANDFIYGLENTDTTSAPTVGSGFSVLTSGVSSSYTGSEYKIVSSTQSSLSFTYSNAASDSNVGWADAIEKASSTTCLSGLTVDNSNDNQCTNATSCSVSLSTSYTNDLVYLTIGDNYGGLSVSSVSDTAGLTWMARQSQTSSSNDEDVFTYYAIASSTLSSDSISVTLSHRTTISLAVVAVANADIAAPFDPNLSSAPTNTGTASTVTVTVTTTNANDLIIGAAQDNSGDNTFSSGAGGYTSFLCCSGNVYFGMEYEKVSATGSYTPTFTLSGGSDNWGEIGDAIEAAPSTATPTTFQEKVTWDPATYATYESSTLSNIRFCSTSNCSTELYAWLESCTSTCGTSATSATAWVKLTSAISSGSSTTIYMVFYPTSTAFDANYWGEAPTLSSSYGQYDDGSNVFTFYDNFAGSSLDNNWQSIIYGGGTVTVNNGVVLSDSSTSDNPMLVSKNTYTPAVLDSDMELSSEQTGQSTPGIFYATTIPATSGGDYGFKTNYRFDWYEPSTIFRLINDISGTATGGPTIAYTLSTTSYGVWSAMWSATGAENFAYNYVFQNIWQNTGITDGASYIGAAAVQGGQANVQWMRLRAVPPNGVMPGASLGTLTGGSNTPSSVTDSLSNTFTLGESNVVSVGTTNYYAYIYYATAASTNSGGDTITATFPISITGSESLYDLPGYSATSPGASTGGSSTAGSTMTVTSFTPASNSFVMGMAETSSSTSAISATGSYTMISTSCSSAAGCSEYLTGSSGATTAQMSLGTAASWVESAISFSEAANAYYNSEIWAATAASGSGADTITVSLSASVSSAFLAIYEVTNLNTAGSTFCTSCTAEQNGNSASQSATSVSSFTPSSSSFIVGSTEAGSTTYTAGSGGYSLTATCSSVYGCSEYQVGGGSATTVPMSMSPSVPWAEVALAIPPTSTIYYSAIYGATEAATGADTITATFSQTVGNFIQSAYDLTGFTLSNDVTGSYTGAGTAVALSSNLTPPGSEPVVIGNVMTSSSSSEYTFTAPFASVKTGTGGCDSSHAAYGCSEYQDGSSSSTTVPFTLSASATWAEVAIGISAEINPQNGQQVGGYPALAVPENVALEWSEQFTNLDPQHRTITVWPTAVVTVGTDMDESFENTVFFIIDGVSVDGTGLVAYNTTKDFVTLPYDTPVTMYFGSKTPEGTATDVLDETAGFQATFSIQGIYSDGTIFEESIPYATGFTTTANAGSSPQAGANGAQISVTCTNPCGFTDSVLGYVGWMNSNGVITTVKTFTTTSSGNLPSGLTFNVPTSTAGYYTIIVSDHINTVFSTFQDTN